MNTEREQINSPEAPLAKDFRLYLQAEFLKRCRKNQRYSLSAFARALRIDVSTLAKLLKGQRPMGRLVIRRLGERLGLAPKQIQAFLIVRQQARAPQAARDSVDPDYQQINLDTFQIISDWYHYAILELMTVKGFRGEPQWIARALEISPAEAAIAIERLVRVGLIEIKENGKWIDRSDGFTTTIGNPFTAAAFRNLQAQVLKKALVALEETPFELRDQTSMTMAIDPARLPEAKEVIKRFRREMNQFFVECGNPSQVYHLGVSLYPVTKIKGEGESV